MILAVLDESIPYFVLTGLLHVLAVARRYSRDLARLAECEPPTPPVVVNLSYGILAGSKDGTGMLDRVLDALADPALRVPGIGPIHVVLPMGNGRQSRSFARVPEGEAVEIGIKIQPDDRTATYVEIRAEGGTDVSLQIQAPGPCDWLEVSEHGDEGYVDLPLGGGVRAYFDQEESQSGHRRAAVLLAYPPTVPLRSGSPYALPGNWRLRVSADRGEVTLAIQRDDSLDGLRSGGRQARFVRQSYTTLSANGRPLTDDPISRPSIVTRAGTFNTLASGRHVWRVGGRFVRNGEVVPYSGLAPEAEDRPAEGDVLEPSDQSNVRLGVLAQSLSGGAPLRVSGTSMSAPRLAHRLACILSESGADRRGRDAILTMLKEGDAASVSEEGSARGWKTVGNHMNLRD